MDSGTFLLGAFGALAFGTLSLCGYLFLLYRFGLWIAKRVLLRIPMWFAPIGFGILWAPLAVASLFLPIDPLMCVAIALCVHLVHVWPTCLGYWSGKITQRTEMERRWRKNADDWLATWECAESEQTRKDTFWN